MDTSLDDFIQAKPSQKGARLSGLANEHVDKGIKLNDHKEKTLSNSSPANGKVKLSSRNKREYGADALKSLDDVVVERNFLKPLASTKPRSFELGDDVFTSPNRIGGSRWGKRRFEDTIDNDEGTFAFNGELHGDIEEPSPAKRQTHWPKGLTPYQAVDYLAEKGMLIELKIGKLVVDNEKEAKKNHLWRCIIVCGGVEGKADSCRKIVAREVAANEFLKMLREEYPDAEVPRYDPPTEFFIHPKVGKWVQDLAAELGFELEFDKTVKTRTRNPNSSQACDSPCQYNMRYHIGGNTFQGASTIEKYSVLDASRKVWEFFTGQKLPYTKYFVGDRCNPQFNYNFIEYYRIEVDLDCAIPDDDKQDITVAHDESYVEEDDTDVDTFPADSFSLALKNNAQLRENLKNAKQVEECKTEGTKEIVARKNEGRLITFP